MRIKWKSLLTYALSLIIGISSFIIASGKAEETCDQALTPQVISELVALKRDYLSTNDRAVYLILEKRFQEKLTEIAKKLGMSKTQLAEKIAVNMLIIAETTFREKNQEVQLAKKLKEDVLTLIRSHPDYVKIHNGALEILEYLKAEGWTLNYIWDTEINLLKVSSPYQMALSMLVLNFNIHELLKEKPNFPVLSNLEKKLHLDVKKWLFLEDMSLIGIAAIEDKVLAQVLILLGADVNMEVYSKKIQSKVSPLAEVILALERKNVVEGFKFLIKNRANVHFKTDDGKNLLRLLCDEMVRLPAASRFFQDKFAPIAVSLLRFDPNFLTEVDSKGISARSYLEATRNYIVINFFDDVLKDIQKKAK